MHITAHFLALSSSPTAMLMQHFDLMPYFLGQVNNPIKDFLNTYKDIAKSSAYLDSRKSRLSFNIYPIHIKLSESL